MCLPSLLYHQLPQLVYSKQGTPSTHLPRPGARNVLVPGGGSGGAPGSFRGQAGAWSAGKLFCQPDASGSPERCGALPDSGADFPTRPTESLIRNRAPLSIWLLGRARRSPAAAGKAAPAAAQRHTASSPPRRGAPPSSPSAETPGSPGTAAPTPDLLPQQTSRRGAPPPRRAVPGAMTPAGMRFHRQPFPS